MLLPSSLVAGQTATLVYDPRLVDGDPVSLVLVVEVDGDSALVASLAGGAECSEWSVLDAEARRGEVTIQPAEDATPDPALVAAYTALIAHAVPGWS